LSAVSHPVRANSQARR